MPRVFIPPFLVTLTDGHRELDVPGGTVAEVIASLEQRYPGIRERLCDGERLRPGVTAVVGDAVGPLGLLQPTPDDVEVHFLPSVGGG